MKTRFIVIFCMLWACCTTGTAQVRWINADKEFGKLPDGFHVYKTNDLLDGSPNIAYYVIADLKEDDLEFTTDTTYRRRLTPSEFYKKNNNPLLVVNGTFFSFETNQNLNVVIRNGKLLAHNVRKVRTRVGDTTAPFKDEKMSRGVLGINKKGDADVAWVRSDTGSIYPDAWQSVWSDTNRYHSKRWKMETAIGGGPVIVQNGRVFVTNEQEKMFAGKAINDKHPRTCIGYTKNNKLIIMVIQGRTPGIAEGATLTQEAKLMADLGCVEALNLDGGGSSCMLINGKQTITPSDKGDQRPVPAVFLIKRKK